MLFLLCWYAVTTFFHDFQTWGKVVWEGGIHKLGCKLLIVTLQWSWKSSQGGWEDIWGDPFESRTSSREAGREPVEERALLQLCCLAHINIYSLPKTAWDFFHILEKIKTMKLINLNELWWDLASRNKVNSLWILLSQVGWIFNHSRSRRSGCLCVTRGVLFALKPTCAQFFCAASMGGMGLISWVDLPSAGLASCPQMPVPAGGDYWWHVPAWNNTEAAVSGYEWRKEPHLEIWQSHFGSEQAWGKSWNRMGRHGNTEGNVWSGGLRAGTRYFVTLRSVIWLHRNIGDIGGKITHFSPNTRQFCNWWSSFM